MIGRASDFEFRNRVWLFGVLFGVAFILAALDPIPAGQRIADRLVAAAQWTSTQALHAVFAVAALVLILAAALRTWGSAYLTREVVHDTAVHGEILHADGPYRHVRNPLYFGNVLLAGSIGLVAPVAGYAVLMLGMILFCYRLIGREESVLTASQGQPFLAYMSAVPRLWPSLRARIAPDTGQPAREPDWISGLAAEAFFWCYPLGMILFALTLNLLWLYGCLLASPLAGWLGGIAVRDRK